MRHAFVGDTFYPQLMLMDFLLWPVLFALAGLVWLFAGLPNHWIWYNLGRRSPSHRAHI